MPPLGSKFVIEAPSIRDVGAGAAAAIGNKVSSCIAHGVLVAHLSDARSDSHEVEHVAIDQRQVVDEPSVDHPWPVTASSVVNACAWADTSIF